jgi:hypothetical protein
MRARKCSFWFAAAAVMAALLSSAAVAQNPPGTPPNTPPATPPAAQAPAPPTTKGGIPLYRFRLLGVYDAQTGEPVEGVEVADVVNRTSSATSKTGTLSLFFLPDGGTLVRLRKVGYETQTFPVSIAAADTAPLTIVLARATQLPTVVVNDSAPKYRSALLRGFETRRAGGVGKFVTEDEFRKADNSTLAFLLSSRLRSVIAVQGPHGTTYLSSARKQCSGPALRGCRSAECYVSVYVDGVKTYDSNSPASLRPDFAHLSPVDYAAAEFYDVSTTPPEYASAGNDCGVLLLWTRES